jgi:two-component system NarL family response regulator
MSETGAPLRVLIVDDHPMMLRGLRGVLTEDADIDVVAEAEDGLAAVAAWQLHQPDVTLMDLAMPRCGGIEAIRAIRAVNPRACIVALTTYAGGGDVLRALEAGAVGYVLKSTVCEDAAAVVRAAHAGRSTMSQQAAAAVASVRLQRLTPREREVLELVAKGCSNRITAEQLGISHETVKGYLSNIMQKLQASDRTHAVVLAIRQGLLD